MANTLATIRIANITPAILKVEEDTNIAPMGVMDEVVELSKDELGRIDEIVKKLFSLHPMSPEYTALADCFHTRTPTKTKARIDASEASNADLAMKMMSDLRKILDTLFPANKDANWDFRTAFEGMKEPVNRILERIEEAKGFILGDLASIDAKRANFFEGIVKLRKSLVTAKTLRVKVEERAEKASERHRDMIMQTVVFYLGQREMDLLTEIAVTTQSFLANDAIRKTNVVLSQNIDRILSTTVQALNNAVFVSTNVAASTLEYAFDTRQLVLGFEGKQIRDMVEQFVALDRDLAQLENKVAEAKQLPAPKTRTKNKINQDSEYHQTLWVTNYKGVTTVRGQKYTSATEAIAAAEAEMAAAAISSADRVRMDAAEQARMAESFRLKKPMGTKVVDSSF